MFVMLGEVFIWKCYINLFFGDILFFVKFYRNNVLSVLIGFMGLDCLIQSLNSSYIYGCLLDKSFILIILVENLIEFE